MVEANTSALVGLMLLVPRQHAQPRKPVWVPDGEWPYVPSHSQAGRRASKYRYSRSGSANGRDRGVNITNILTGSTPERPTITGVSSATGGVCVGALAVSRTCVGATRLVRVTVASEGQLLLAVYALHKVDVVDPVRPVAIVLVPVARDRNVTSITTVERG